MYDYNSNLLKISQTLRKNMTPEEKQLWYHLLCRLPVPVKRQKIIGKYIVDFYIPEYKVVIEIDGYGFKTEAMKDDRRTTAIFAYGKCILIHPSYA